MTPVLIRSPALALPGVRHAFFTRHGGVSEGVYASLNGGVGSRDAPAAVAENRRRMAEALGVDPGRFCVPFQVHSAEALRIDGPFGPGEGPRVDGLVTGASGLGLGVTGADCGMVLLADPDARVVGAVHAGWKGALTGALEATVRAMEDAGARRAAITAVLGPAIAQASYEVGPDFKVRFTEADPASAAFFRTGRRAGHALFDLPGFIVMRLMRARVGRVENLALDTYADEARFFSYRRATHRGEPDYGRLVAAIALAAP